MDSQCTKKSDILVPIKKIKNTYTKRLCSIVYKSEALPSDLLDIVVSYNGCGVNHISSNARQILEERFGAEFNPLCNCFI